MSLRDLIPWRGKRTEDDRGQVPAHPIERMRYDMDRVFDRFFGNWWDMYRTPALGGFDWSPALDVSETDAEVILRAEIPGVDAKDLDISITGDVLTLSGQKEEKKEKQEEGFVHSECRFGSFRRTMPLPASVDTENIQAEYSNGVLTVRLKKLPEATAKKIPVKVT